MRRRNFLFSTFSVLATALPSRSFFKRKPDCITGQDDEGPYFKAGAPLRKNIAEDFKGKATQPLNLQGRVFASCNGAALEQAEIDLWHAHPDGNYDMKGYICRGKQKTSADGAYEFDTLMPARYPGRPLHLHIKVTSPGYRTLTTQVYFESDGARKRDYLFRKNRGAERTISIDQGKGKFDVYLEKV